MFVLKLSFLLTGLALSVYAQVQPSTYAQVQPSTISKETQFAQLEALLSKITPPFRGSVLPHVALAAFDAKAFDKAASYAQETLSYASASSSDQGSQEYYGNEVMGLLALQKGDIATAKYYLLKSGASVGSKTIAQFGPNMSLAAGVLAKGETATFLKFLDLCKKLWPTGDLTIRKWQALAQANLTPDFDRYLLVQP